ncbi:CoA ester lyase [Allosphingosinicella flava]|uniref:CoA ester lyase n=1 Tax=Allosphingosinicella flava TaxID=2771430 RepID=A0A7T2GIB3_9SPHN|nr:CoA ester lyase [Sphingosinicella flava]
MKSWLCASALKAGLSEKASDRGADAVLYDLEDSVPIHQKEEARRELVRLLGEPQPVKVAVRINGVRTEEGLKDVLALLERAGSIDSILLPKARLPGDVEFLHALLAEVQQAIPIFAIVESVASLWDLRHLNQKPEGLAGLVFGSADFATDLGIALDGANLTYAKSEIAFTARRLGITAIDSPCFRIDDPDLLKHELNDAKSLGYSGKIAIHPGQIPLINAIFTPTEAEMERAAMVLDALRRGDHGGIARIGSAMVGPPFAKHASRILAAGPSAAAPPCEEGGTL